METSEQTVLFFPLLMIWLVFHIAEIILWLLLAGPVGYVAFFATVSLLKRRNKKESVVFPAHCDTPFVIFIPAYHEDGVIRQSVESVLNQDYPQKLFRLVVISDHMSPATNDWLAQQSLTLLQPQFEKSSKGKGLQYAVTETAQAHDFPEQGRQGALRAVILDADNIVSSDFLQRLHQVCQLGHQAIQCHRTAKNSNNEIAALDGISEEINNTIFRRAHNHIGLSSALIGSGMCFSYEWFAAHVDCLSTAVEDRELETLLLRERIHIHYAEDILVMDEKVSSKDNFQRQRLRWMTGQIQSLFAMLPYVPKALLNGNLDYVDKTIQQALIPRSILLLLLPLFSVVITFCSWTWSIKWWVLFLVFCLSLFIAIPKPLRSKALVGKALVLPSLAWRMTKNLFKIDRKDTTFHHTDHTDSIS